MQDSCDGKGLVIHVGYPKTASTWLQRHLFANPRTAFAVPWGQPAACAVDHFVLANDYVFEANSVREALRTQITATLKASRVPVLSEETLIGDPCRQKYWGFSTMRRIRSVFPMAKILLCIREQVSLAYSAYCEHLRGGGTDSLERFVGTGRLPPGVGPNLRFDYLQYDLVISDLLELFGPSQVLVLPVELLRLEPRDFVNRLCEFAGTRPVQLDSLARVHASVGGRTVPLHRWLNRWVPPGVPRRLVQKLVNLHSRLTPLGAHSVSASREKRKLAEHLGSYFEESNRRSAELTGVDLRSLGYRVAGIQ